eukprot:439446_1
MSPKQILQLASFIFTTCLCTTYIDSEALSGKSTWYNIPNGNPTTCGENIIDSTTFPYGYYGACGSKVFDNGYGCNSCYEITCINSYDIQNTNCNCSSLTPSVIISCNDQCAGCSDTEFQLNPIAMSRIIGPGQINICGSIETTIRRVECEYETNIQIMPKSGSSSHWYGLYIININGFGTIQSVQLKPSNSLSYTTFCDKDYGPSYWYCSGGFPLIPPLTVKLKNKNNEISIFKDCIKTIDDDVIFDCGGNWGTITDNIPTIISDNNNINIPTIITSYIPTSEIDICSEWNISFKMHKSSQQYWLAFFIKDFCPYCSYINNIQLKDSSNYKEWVWGWLTSDDENGYWFWDDVKERHGGQPWTPPITVKIEATAGTLIFNDILMAVRGTYYSTKSFCRMEEEQQDDTEHNHAYCVKMQSVIFVCLVVNFIFL